jgi:hypothetical protein
MDRGAKFHLQENRGYEKDKSMLLTNPMEAEEIKLFAKHILL